MKVYGINTCSTYKKALNWFTAHKIAFEAINVREAAPTKKELMEYHLLSGLDIKKFLNTSGALYRELNIKEKLKDLSNDEIYELLSSQPMLIKRPLVVDGEYVRTGFNEEEYKQKWL